MIKYDKKLKGFFANSKDEKLVYFQTKNYQIMLI